MEIIANPAPRSARGAGKAAGTKHKNKEALLDANGFPVARDAHRRRRDEVTILSPLDEDGKPVLPEQHIQKLEVADALTTIGRRRNPARALAAAPVDPESDQATKVTKAADIVRNAFMNSFEDLGGEEFMKTWAARNPGEFMKLLQKFGTPLKDEGKSSANVVIVTNIPTSPLDL